jgi:aminodeoxyfutalosine synthase
MEKERISEEEALLLYRSDDIHTLGKAAETVNRRINRSYAYFIVNRHINPTNICVNRCRFCAFSRSWGQEGAYELTIEEILEKISSSEELLTEVHIVGGLHPYWSFDHYCRILTSIKKHFPSIQIKAFTAVEIDYFSRISGLSIRDVLMALKDNGLDLMPGGGAEILVHNIRQRLCPEKISADRWLEIHKIAHTLGIKTNATMLYGHIESLEDRIRHLSMLRALQDETGGFQAFIPLAYHATDTNMSSSIASGIDDLKTIAISRLFLDNIPHIKAYWIMLGEKLSQIALLFGADDLEGTVLEEKITHSAGATSAEGMKKEELVYLIKRTGKVPVQRDSFYNPLKVYDE